MPYNNTPITPAKDITGTVSLPLARVKKIIATDDEISNCSNNAAFVITVAAEMFLQHLVEQSYNIVKSGGGDGGGRNAGKPRRNIQYRDVANAVARVENLEFLTDVVPKTTTYRTFKQKQTATTTPNPPVQQQPNGQSTLDTHMGAVGMGVVEQQATNGASPPSPEVLISRPPVEVMDVDVVDADDKDDLNEMEDVDDDREVGDEGGSMHTAKDEPVLAPERDPELLERRGMDMEVE